MANIGENFLEASGGFTFSDAVAVNSVSELECGFGYGILKAVHTGLIHESYAQVAYKALQPILGYIADDGVVGQVSYGTPMGRQTKEFYKNIELRQMPYGQALAMLFLIECLA